MRTRCSLILASLAVVATLLFSGAAFAQGDGPGPVNHKNFPAAAHQSCDRYYYAEWDGPHGPKPHKAKAQHKYAPVPAHSMAPGRSAAPLIINIGFD